MTPLENTSVLTYNIGQIHLNYSFHFKLPNFNLNCHLNNVFQGLVLNHTETKVWNETRRIKREKLVKKTSYRDINELF